MLDAGTGGRVVGGAIAGNVPSPADTGTGGCVVGGGGINVVDCC